MHRDFKGVWIPKEIYLHPELSWTEKLLLVEIDSLDQGEGCWASNEHLAGFVKITTRQASSAISKLTEMGLVKVESFDGRKRYLKSLINRDWKKTSMQGGRKLPGSLEVNGMSHNIFPSNNSSTEPQKEGQYPPSNTVSNTSETSLKSETSPEKEERLQLDVDGFPIRPVVKLSQGKSQKDKNVQSNILKLIFWAEKRRGAEFPNRKKQMKALHVCVDIGATPESVKNRWVDLENDSFYQKIGLDFMSVLNSFDKKPWNKDWN